LKQPGSISLLTSRYLNWPLYLNNMFCKWFLCQHSSGDHTKIKVNTTFPTSRNKQWPLTCIFFWQNLSNLSGSSYFSFPCSSYHFSSSSSTLHTDWNSPRRNRQEPPFLCTILINCSTGVQYSSLFVVSWEMNEKHSLHLVLGTSEQHKDPYYTATWTRHAHHGSFIYHYQA
jgi:hypothetical protein